MKYREGTSGNPKIEGKFQVYSKLLDYPSFVDSGDVAPSPSALGTEGLRIFPDFVAVVAKEGDTFSSLSAKYLKDPSWAWFIAEFNEIDPSRRGNRLSSP